MAKRKRRLSERLMGARVRLDALRGEVERGQRRFQIKDGKATRSSARRLARLKVLERACRRVERELHRKRERIAGRRKGDPK